VLQLVADWLVYSVFRLNPETRLGQSINFFFYDSLKILLLIFVFIAIIGFLRSFLPPSKIREWIINRKGFGNFFASLFGALTPFCSCSSIPIFLSFLKANIPLGITFSFLITSPMINEYLVVLMLGFFGWKITALYVLSGLFIGTFSGIVLGKMDLEKYLVADLLDSEAGDKEEMAFENLKGRIAYGLGEARAIVKKIWIWILVGVGIGSFIHNYIPQETVQAIISKTGFFSVPMATILGVPMYGSCAAIVPIAVVLFKKGIPLGTALAFMMATATLSLPEAIMLRRAMHLKLIAIFFGIVTFFIVLTGYCFNFLQIALTP